MPAINGAEYVVALRKKDEERRRRKRYEEKKLTNLAEKPRGEHDNSLPHKGKPGRGKDHRQEGNVPDEVLRGADFLKGHKGKGLCKGAKQDVLVEQDGKNCLKQELGKEGKKSNQV